MCSIAENCLALCAVYTPEWRDWDAMLSGMGEEWSRWVETLGGKMEFWVTLVYM